MQSDRFLAEHVRDKIKKELSQKYNPSAEELVEDIKREQKKIKIMK